MAAVHVVTDSACDLAPDVAEARGITVVPLTIRFGDDELVDQVELSAKEFWDRVITGPHMPETAAPSPGAFQQAFLDAAEAGAPGVLCVNLSSGVSATYQSARTAADAVADRIPVAVVDSQTLTLGIGHMALAAAEMAAGGMPLDTLVAEIEAMKARTAVYGIIDSLDFLRRGGRIGGAQRLIGSMLSIKPVIEIRGGVVEVESKQRTRVRSFEYVSAKVRDAGPLDRLALVNGAATDFDLLAGMMADVHDPKDTLLGDLGPVIGAHAGPGTIGICLVRSR